MNGTFPAIAIPAPILASDCSATPICTNRSGNAFLNASDLVDSVKSQQRTTTFLSRLPASTTPSPYPFRVGICLRDFVSSRLRARNMAGFNPFCIFFVLILFVLRLNFSPERSQILQRVFCFFPFCWWLSVPKKIVFHKIHSVAWNGVCNNHTTFVRHSLCSLDGRHKIANVISCTANHIQSERFKLGGKRFKRHDFLCRSINLNVVAINNHGEIIQLVCAGKLNCFPRLSFLEFAVRHATINTPWRFIHEGGICHTGGLRGSRAEWTGCGLKRGHPFIFWMSLKWGTHFTERHEQFFWKISCVRHGDVSDWGDVTV